MKKKLLTIVIAMTMISLTACGNAVDNTKKAVETYNEAVKTYNEQAGEYITASQATVDANEELNSAMTAAQEVINKGEEPFDEETLATLKAAISTASEKQIADPELLPVYEEVTVDENASKEDLKAMKEKAESDTKAIQEVAVPDEIPEVPNYILKKITLLISEQTAAERLKYILPKKRQHQEAIILAHSIRQDLLLDLITYTEHL